TAGEQIVVYNRSGDSFSKLPYPGWPSGWPDNQGRGLAWAGNTIVMPFSPSPGRAGDYRRWIYSGSGVTGSSVITELPARPTTFDSVVLSDGLMTFGLADAPYVANFTENDNSQGTLGISPSGPFERPVY